MALIRCEQCGKEISDTMNVCPFCGSARQKEEAIAYFHVANMKTEENKPLMKKNCITVYGVMAACVFLRLQLPVLYGNIFGPILGTDFYTFMGAIYGGQNSILPLFFFILIGCGWMILWYSLRSKPSQKMAALGIGIAGLLVFIGANYAIAAVTINIVFTNFEYLKFLAGESVFVPLYFGVVFPLLFFFASLFAYGRKPAMGILHGGIFLLISEVLLFIKSWVCISFFHFGFFGVCSFLDIPVVLLAAGLFAGAEGVIRAMKKA